MASLQKKGNGWYCQFLFHGKRKTLTLGAVTESEAKTKSAQVDYLLMRLKQGLIEVPPAVDIIDFLRYDGAPPDKPVAFSVAFRVEPTLAELRDHYLETHANGSLELHTIKGIRRHFGHLSQHLGDGFPVHTLPLSDV